MKSTIKFFLAAIATGLVMTSCSDELVSEENGSYSQSEGTRVITATFGPQTRTALENDGLTPKFTGEDEWVMVSNENESEKCPIIIENGVAFFKTNLKGTLKAVYPLDAALIGKEKIITGITIPTTQTGKFADANICMAENISNSATFENKTAILKFYVDESINVKEIDIIGDKITGTPNNTIRVFDQQKRSLHEVTDGPDKRICYVAVNSGVTANGLTFKSYTETQGEVVRKSPVNVTLEAGKMYNAFIPYYIEVNDVKWGYCNVGAFLPEEPGEYFAWGETIGHKWNASEKKFDNGYNFNWANTPFNGANASFDQTYFNSTKEIAYPNGTLALKYDAANANWGDKWRMPTGVDRQKLSDAKPTASGGMMVVEGTALKFPAAGYGDGAQLKYYSSESNFWTSSLNNYDHLYALIFWFGSSQTSFSAGAYRYQGCSVRPVYDENAILKEPVLLPGEYTVNGDGKKVRFTGGNLYFTANVWKVEQNQFTTHTGDGGIGLFYFNSTAEKSMASSYTPDNTETDLFCSSQSPLTIDGSEGYYVPSKDDWTYIINTRTQTNRFARAKANDRNCLIIFPDGYKKDNLVSCTGIGTVNNASNEAFPSDNIELAVRVKMESDGVVFLPAIYEKNQYGSIWVASNISYRSSTPHETLDAYYLLANTTQVKPGFCWGISSSYVREMGFPIRLVKNIP